MMRWAATWVVVCGAAWAQGTAHDLPPAILAVKTVAIINNTNDSQLTKGAEQALAAWGQFQLTQDTEAADLTLRFEKVKSHSGQGSATRDETTGQWNTGYGVSFNSSIHMKAYLKDSDAAVYETKTDDAKTKAGMSCINDFHAAYRTARQQAAPPTP